MSEKPFDAPTTRVTFFQVKKGTEKLTHIANMARVHFAKKEPFLIFVEDEKGEVFVDELLWKFPAVSFLPHIVLNNHEDVPIAITRLKKNVNTARHAFNLCPTPLLLPGFRVIYEFEDLTAPNKQALSSLRFTSYKQAGYILEAQIN